MRADVATAEAPALAQHPEPELATRHPLRGDTRGYRMRRLLAASDALALLVALGVAWLAEQAVGRSSAAGEALWLFVLLIPAWIVIASLLRLYHLGERRLDPSGADEIAPVILATTVWSWGYLVARTGIEAGSVELFLPIVLWIAMIPAVLMLRAVARRLARSRDWYRQRVAVAGSPADVSAVLRRLRRHPEYGLEVVHVVEDPDRPIVPEELAEVVLAAGVNRVIVATPPERGTRSALIRILAELDMQIDMVTGEPEVFSSSTTLHTVEGLPMLTIPAVRTARAWRAVKRATDLVASGTALILLSPLLAAVALAIKLESRGPVLFRQERIGHRGERFRLLKLRTMVDGADARKLEVAAWNMHAIGNGNRNGSAYGNGNGNGNGQMFKVARDPRITRVGAWLRRWSLDEVPQLWNVVKGEMSLVGPRPLIPEEASLVRGHYAKRFEARPGVTGLWQALGRSDIGFDDMVMLDYTYVTNWSFAEDVKVLLRTVGAVIDKRGAY